MVGWKGIDYPLLLGLPHLYRGIIPGIIQGVPSAAEGTCMWAHIKGADRGSGQKGGLRRGTAGGPVKYQCRYPGEMSPHYHSMPGGHVPECRSAGP